MADGFLTNILIQKGIAFEGNPFLVSIAGTHSLIWLKSLGVLIAVVILWDIYRRSPRLSFWASSAFLLVYICIVAWNSLLLVVGLSYGI
ncbi:MAG TPA: DUF5658 family protein [Dehalococcoidales bacterium]|nr:DUF5658 family protein [Dehalococcoidales bacterium]